MAAENMIMKTMQKMEVANQSGAAKEMDAKPGRPRSMPARKSILNATRRLLSQMSMAELSIEAIAKRAGVGKTTIYRWWPSKAAVAMEAFLDQPGIQHVTSASPSATDAIRYQLEALIRQLRGQNGRIIAGVIAEGQSDQKALDLLYEEYLKDRVNTLYEQLEHGCENGEFRSDLDIDIAADMLLGPLFLRILSGEHGIDDVFAQNYPLQAVKALRF